MQDNDCLFCRIIKGEIPSTKVFESDLLLAFLDINPVNKGHVLIIPKEHAETVFDLRPELAEPILKAIQRIGKAIMKATGAEGMNVLQNNYKASGQAVGHVHWHLIPRHFGDGHKHWPPKHYKDNDEMHAVAEAIKACL